MAVQQDIGGRCYIDNRNGSRDQARAYCMKQESRMALPDVEASLAAAFDENLGTGPYERGLWVREGHPTTKMNLDDFAREVMAGKTDSELAARAPALFMRNAKHIHALRRELAPKGFVKKDVTVIHGDTGVGKSRQVWEAAGREGKELYKCSLGAKGWYDGYDGQEWVLFDDFNSEIPIQEMLNLLDGYPHIVAVKGASTPWYPKKIWITSNIPPAEWYPKETEVHKKALQRRITEVVAIGIADTRVTAVESLLVPQDQPTITNAFGVAVPDYRATYLSTA